MKGKKNGWYYDCYDKRTYPVDKQLSLNDRDRLEFLLLGWKISSTGDSKRFFIHPITGYFETPREAVDCAIDIFRQREWRCYRSYESCMEKVTHRITYVGRSANTFKMCAKHTGPYQSPEARDQWKIEELV